MANEIKNIFISHIHEDDEGLGKLKDICQINGLEVRDGSVNSDKPNDAKDPDYIKREILRPRIEWASTLVVYITPDTKDSEWVAWEIELAQELGKRIVGVWAYGENECAMPDALDKYHDAVVGWHGESIVDAITGKSNASYDCQGGQRGYRPIRRHNC